MQKYVVTFDRRPVVGVGALDGLKRVTLEEARAIQAVAARIPKRCQIINAETLEVV